MNFTMSSDKGPSFTLVPNAFISDYMPSANGNFVKVYFYLLMLFQHPETLEDRSISGLADMMECTENDILRALRYWKKQGLLSFMQSGDEIQNIHLTSPDSDVPADTVAASYETASTQSNITENTLTNNTAAEESKPQEEEKKSLPVEEEIYIPAKQTYTALQAEALCNDIEIGHALEEVEQILGEPLSPTHLQTILYFMCDVGFSADLLITLYKTAVRKGKKQPRYIEAIGISWAKQGIRTSEEAIKESESFGGRYALITRTLGITEPLAPVNREIIDEWDTYDFSDDMIEEACRRGALQTGGGVSSLRYISGILKKWNKEDIRTREDLKKSDASFQQKKKEKTNEQKHTQKKQNSPKNQFQNFPQRDYSDEDVNSLEKKLLKNRKN